MRLVLYFFVSLSQLYQFNIENMKRIILFFAIIVGFASQNYAQKVYSTDADYKADVKVYVVDADYKADLLVYKVDADYKKIEKEEYTSFDITY